MANEFIELLRQIKLVVSNQYFEIIEKYMGNGNEELMEGLPELNLDYNRWLGYQERELLYTIINNFKDGEEKLKRAVKVLFKICGESYLKIIYNRFYNLNKVVDYLKKYLEGEKLIVWVLKFRNHTEQETITALESILEVDSDGFQKAYNILDKDDLKLKLILFMKRNKVALSEEQEKFQAEFFEGDLTNKLNNKALHELVQFLYYANETKKEAKGILSNIINSEVVNLFRSNLIAYSFFTFVKNFEPKTSLYELSVKFNIDKKFYAVWLMREYLLCQDNSTLEKINLFLSEDIVVFREVLEITPTKDIRVNNDADFIKFCITYFIYGYSKNSDDFNKFKDMAVEFIISYIFVNLKCEKKPYRDERENVSSYFKGEASEEIIQKFTKKFKLISVQGYIEHNYKKIFKHLYKIQKFRDTMLKFLNIFIITEKYDIVAGIIDSIIEDEPEKFIDIMEALKDNKVSETSILFIINICLNYYEFTNKSIAKKYFTKFIENEDDKVIIENISDISIEAKEIVLEGLFKKDKLKYVDILISNLGDSAKSIRNKVVELLSECEASKDKLLESLKSKKTAVREDAIRILANFNMTENRTELEKALSVEKNEKVKNLIMNILNFEDIKNLEFNNSDAINKYCIEKLKASKAKVLDWLDVKAMPKVKFSSDEEVKDEVMEYLLIRYSTENTLTKNEEAEKIFIHMNKSELDKFANEVLNVWIQAGADVKKKWVLSFIAGCGGFNVVNTLKKQIELWAQTSRGAIACEAVKALALLGSDEALIVIDSIARKFKFKQVKKTAAEAFEFAAQTLNVDYEELADKIVPDLEFNQSGEKSVDYGTRKFTITLERNFSLKIVDENGKVLKNLPKPNKNDNEVLALEALEEHKILKKQLKNAVSSQTTRLELALSVNRLWTKEAWEKLFVKNPIMHNFSLGLIWGVYNKGKLEATFRYMEDGTFNTKDEAEFELTDNAMIGLVHPLELEEDQKETWTQQLEDYEIKQPLEQLSRPVYTITDEEVNMKWIERFGGKKINGLSLIGKLTKFGWYKGSIQDAGSYYQVYKENKAIGIGAEVNFSYLCIGCEDEETTIQELVFYKAGTIERGSYVYDEVTDKNMIVPKEVSARFFSEILYDMERTLEASTGFNRSWKQESYRN